MGKRAEVEEAERLLLIKECLAKRMRIREAARRAGVHPSTIEKWISHYEAEEEAGLQDRNKAQKSYDEETKRKQWQIIFQEGAACCLLQDGIAYDRKIFYCGG